MIQRKRVVVAMSGGVDSSVAAALLLNEGYNVIGITLKLWPKHLCGQKQPRSCCSLQDIEDAKSVAQKLNIPFYVLNMEKEFAREVIDYFCGDYAKGRTPNPCIVCNQRIKFGTLLNKAKELGAQYVATGHYARVLFDKRIKRFVIKEGKDKTKDQSYALFSLNQNQLAHCLLPIGKYRKTQIRQIAFKFGLKTHQKPDSQEICFVPANDYHKFLKDKLNGKIIPGDIVDRIGRMVGKHRGICFYTIGQRKGLGAFGKPVYVTNIDAVNHTITIGREKDLKKKEFLANNLNWMIRPKKRLGATVKIRYNHPKAKAMVELINDNLARVTFASGQSAITPGQAAVFYQGHTVVGGGWIQ